MQSIIQILMEVGMKGELSRESDKKQGSIHLSRARLLLYFSTTHLVSGRKKRSSIN